MLWIRPDRNGLNLIGNEHSKRECVGYQIERMITGE